MVRELPEGTVTFLFTDIEGSTRLLQGLGDAYGSVLERHAELVRAALADHAGVEVDTEGDSFFAVFRTASDAVRAAVSIQRSLAAEPWPDERAVAVRMGVHTGQARRGGDSYIGLDVHLAARIAAAAHGGELLLSAATESLVEPGSIDGIALRDLGSHRLKDFDTPIRLWQVLIDGLRQEFPALRSLEAPVDLPAELTTFVGRAEEVRAIGDLLVQARLLTLTGAGGTGKTRLAVRVASDARSAFPDGVFFVDLGAVSDVTLVAPTIARTLGLQERPDRETLDLIARHLESRVVLLVLDNFEQLLGAVDVVDTLLRASSRLKVLVTSRSRLGLAGEREYPVPPLAMPDPGATDPTALAANEAVALFVDRARTIDPGFVVGPEVLRVIAEICARLDGLPLAIELAASRTRVLEPAALLARLDDRLALLTGGGTNRPARQRTLRGAIEWSYELLPEAERALFGRLAIFAGGWTLEAAEAIGGPADTLAIDTLDGLAVLLDQSLIRRIREAAGARFTMLETIREYGIERLTADASLATMAGRHLDYFRDLAEAAEPHLLGEGQAQRLDRLEAERDNLRAALAWARDGDRPADGLRLASAAWRFWQQRGYLREGRAWLEGLLERSGDVDPAIRARAYTALGGLTYWLADAPATEDAYGAALAIWRQAGDPAAEAEALYNLSYVQVMRGDAVGARRYLEESLERATASGREDVQAMARHSLGMALAMSGDPEAGLPLLESALGYFRAIGDQYQVAWTLGELGQTYRLFGQPERARAAFVEALGMHERAGNLPGIGATLETMAALESGRGRHADAIRLLSAAAAIRATTGATAPVLYTQLGDIESAARRAIGDEAVDTRAGGRSSDDVGGGRRLRARPLIEEPATVMMSVPMPWMMPR